MNCTANTWTVYRWWA